MANTYEHIHQATNGDLGKMLMEYARRHVGDEKETLLEAARRLKSCSIIPSECIPIDVFNRTCNDQRGTSPLL